MTLIEFPIPLTIFEEYMLLDSRKDYPMSIYIRLQFQGALDQADFEQAFQKALERHPLFRAQVQKQPACFVPDIAGWQPIRKRVTTKA